MKKNLLFLICCFWSICASAQLTIGNSAGQTITQKSIDGCAVVVKQSYQVKNKKNGKVYGRNGRKEFGQNYTIGVKTEAGLILTEAALKPWLEDNAFKKVEQTHEPFVSQTEVRDINENEQTKFGSCPLSIGKQQPQGLWVAKTESVVPNAMEIDVEGGEKDGWLIWFTAKKELNANPEATITLQAINKKIVLEDGISEIDIEATANSDVVLGAIYVCPAYLGGGHVAYRLVGVAVKDGKQWKLHTPFVGYSFDGKAVKQEQTQETPQEEEAVTEEEQEEEIDLTPVAKEKNKDKKKKKSKK